MPLPSLRRLLGLGLLALLLVPGDDELLREFRRYFKKYEDDATRIEAVLALDGLDSRSLVDALLPVLEHPSPDVVRAAVRVLSHASGPEAVARMRDRLEKKRDPVLRVGLLRAFREGPLPGAAEAGLALLGAPEWEVRRAAVLAAALSQDDEVLTRVATLADDPEPGVRVSVLDGLAESRSPHLLEPALRLLADPSWRVRASAVAALGALRARAGIQPLIERMPLEEGRLREDIGEALERITGRGFGPRTENWQHFWKSFGDVFEVPTDEELQRLRHVQAQRVAKYDPGSRGLTYHGIQSLSQRVVFVVDVSASMEYEMTDEERYPRDEFHERRRLDVVKRELLGTLSALDPSTSFNVIAFASDVRSWKDDLVGANPLNVSSALDWVSALEVVGGESSRAQRPGGTDPRASYVDAAATGRTNTFGALAKAMGFDPVNPRSGDLRVDVDTIFFLSDGQATTGLYVAYTDILRAVREANRLRKIVIHTLGIGDFQAELMAGLARENGGTYSDLGR